MRRKTYPPIARSGRIVLTLLFMLLATVSAWADNPKLHVSIHYVELTASDATVKMNYGPFQNQTVTDGYELNGYLMGRDFSFTVTSALSITTEFSAIANGQSITVTKNGNTCSFTADEAYNTTLDITITSAGVYNVHFDANGGTGTMADQTYSNMQWANLNANTFTRDGYTFTGWNTAADGSGDTYVNQQNIHPSSGMTLYAQWNKGAMTIAKEQGKIVVTLDGDSNEPFKITSNIQVQKVILRRKFVQGVPTTICLPFAFSKANFDNETFSTLNYVDEDKATHQLVAHMTAVNDLQANTPYYFEPSSTTATPANENYTEIEFYNVTIVAGNAGSSTSGDWTIVGNYDRVKWTTNTEDPLYSSTHAAELGRAYGYAKKTKTVGGVTYQEGQFVKLGDGAHTRAFRAYMLAPATNNSPGLNDLPDTIDVVWHNDDATGVTSMSDGRRQMSDVWYDLSGRKLSGKPTAKGIYINNGRKVVIR